ncbi:MULTISPECIES: ATP-binding protein [Natrialbaceae]|uniref:ATP-binding protein n=1 Tax=Natrialbaceae TaxID=1644061 RepID=UPI00207C37A9|nr:ATP-binding protein [Natronococcus sp. CG52]
MGFWKSVVSSIGGRRAVVALGALYVTLAVGWTYVEVTGGTAVSNALIISFFVGGPGTILLYGGYRLPRTDINPKFYPYITGWCLGAITVMTGLLTLYHLQPAASLSNPVRAMLIITGFVLVPAFAGGVNDARAKTHAFELERALNLLHTTERTADVGGWEIDPDTREVFWTNHLFHLLGVSSDEEPSLDQALDVYHEDDRPIIEDAIDEALEAGDSFDVEVRFHPPSGEVRWLRVQGIPEAVDGDVVSLRGAAQDITGRKERERALERANERLKESNERLEQFAYAASHDLQEPLRMVTSYLQLIENRYDDKLDEDGEEFLEFAVDGADRMREMIDGLLHYSRVETQGEPLEPVDLDAVVADVRDDLNVQIIESGAEMNIEELPRVKGDESQLRQLFQNLLSNALEYSGDEPPRVRIFAERNNPMWRVSVRDEGIGIDRDEQERIFEIFQRLHSPDKHPGSGIGLALCKRIIERHDGEIWVDSELDEGSTFSFTLFPAAESDE